MDNEALSLNDYPYENSLMTPSLALMVAGSDLDLGSEKCPSDYPWLLITSHITSGGIIRVRYND